LNLLFLTPQLPHPPRQGTAIRNWGLIRHLAERHTIVLLSFREAGQHVTPELEAACRRVVTVPAPHRSRADRLGTLLTPHADLARRLWSPEFARTLAKAVQDGPADIVHIEGLEMAPYLAALMSGPRLRTLYDAHNAEHLLQRRALHTDLRQPARWPAALYSALQLPRLRRFEAETVRRASAVTCVSAEDASALRALAPQCQPIVVPNGIDLADYAVAAAPRANGAPRLVFTGKMDYRPNVDAALWFTDQIWPRVHARWPSAQFVIVGQKPAPRVEALRRRDGVAVTGAVEDVRPYIAGATVYVAPLRMGGGTRFKLLEAMALARPIVSTRLGAEGFAAEDGRELRLADTPEDFAQAVVMLLNNPEEAERLGQAGRAFVRAHYDWATITPRLEAVYVRQP
jgi:sugar transferase (PEP-CTERM/EpsH1 system associated)